MASRPKGYMAGVIGATRSRRLGVEAPVYPGGRVIPQADYGRFFSGAGNLPPESEMFCVYEDVRDFAFEVMRAIGGNLPEVVVSGEINEMSRDDARARYDFAAMAVVRARKISYEPFDMRIVIYHGDRDAERDLKGCVTSGLRRVAQAIEDRGQEAFTAIRDGDGLRVSRK